MQKILLVMDAMQYNVNMLHFGFYLARLTRSKLLGVFVEETTDARASAVMSLHENAGEMVLPTEVIEHEERNRVREQNVQAFSNACEHNAVNCSVHYTNGDPVDEIITESRYADMLVVDPEMSLNKTGEGVPSTYIKKLLEKSECPVVVAPFAYSEIDEILFAYDGSRSAVYAIKQFAYLFPQLAEKRLTVLQVDEGDELPVIEKNKLGGLLGSHFASIGFQRLHGQADDELFTFLLGKKNIFVVMGAYGRPVLADIFRHSTAELLIKTLNLPFFIAHH
jgi:nucleotide-binding universal stress UspA family protein